MQPTLAQAVDMHQFIRCQIARGIHCSTEHAEYHIVRLHEEAKSQAQGLVVRVVLLLELHDGASVLLFFLIFDKVHIYSGEGRKTAAQHQHEMNDIDQPTMVEYILASMRTRMCVLTPRLSQGTAVGSLSSIEIGLLTLLSHMLVICQEQVL